MKYSFSVMLLLTITFIGCDPIKKFWPGTHKSSDPAKTKRPMAAKSALNHQKIHAALDKLVPRDGSELSYEQIVAIADFSPGVSSNQTITVNKEVYVIYAGLENNITIAVPEPAAIIVYQGNDNFYAINKESFKDDVLLITHQGHLNKYHGVTPMTVEDYRDTY